MPEPIELRIFGMFGSLDHRVGLGRAGRVRILTGPNGSGKTHVLNVLKRMVGLDFEPLIGFPLAAAEVHYSDGSVLRAELTSGDGSPLVRVVGRRDKHQLGSIDVHPSQIGRDELPPYIERVGRDVWYDARDGRRVSREHILRNYRSGPQHGWSEQAPWLEPFIPPAPPILIATARLDAGPADLEVQTVGTHVRRRPEAAARIVEYAERITAQVSEARRSSLAQSQRADRGFAARALDKARETVKESELRQRYERISALNEQLHANGLTERAVSVAMPSGRTNPTERRILNIFLDDWEAKLAPLQPVHEKLQLLRDIVGTKMSLKELEFGPHGELQFQSHTGQPISVDMLSSGEQHLLALHTMLLFSAAEGSLVLIDEPEISLHAAWKHAFLGDIERVAELNDLRVVLATHSTAIINGRWDLVEEIGTEAPT